MFELCARLLFLQVSAASNAPKASDLSASPTFLALVLALVLALGAVVWAMGAETSSNPTTSKGFKAH